MKILDHSFFSPALDLACDEALLDAAEASDGDEVLRFWQPKDHFIVLGYSNEWKKEVASSPKKRVFRRCSGGGTVLQGPGCLNYSLILKIQPGGDTDTIHSTNAYVMEKNRSALERLLKRPVKVAGHTDLVVETQNFASLHKFSGNAQRRKRKYLLFHGTFLLSFDIARMEKALKLPEKRPAYREDRTHSAFVTNLGVSAKKVKEALAVSWKAKGRFTEIPQKAIKALARERYSKDDWNFKF